MSVKIVINRIIEGYKQTLGHGSIINGDEVFTFVTLELPNLHNQTNISSIPAGKYKCEVVTRSNGKKAILIKNVPGRSGILIHIGNYYTDILGCVLVGQYFNDINNDSVADIINSTITMNEILNRCPNEGIEFDIEIKKLIA